MKKIKLSQNKFALVDNEDFEYLNQFNWYASYDNNTKSFYAVRNVRLSKHKAKIISMSRVIMDCPVGLQVNHANHNTLNNCKHNLRIVTRQQSHMNQMRHKTDFSSKYKGVYWHKNANKWHVQIVVNGKRIYLGLFDDEKLASRCYNIMALYFFGQYAYLNL